MCLYVREIERVAIHMLLQMTTVPPTKSSLQHDDSGTGHGFGRLRIITIDLEHLSSTLCYHQILLIFCHSVRMSDENASSFYILTFTIF